MLFQDQIAVVDDGRPLSALGVSPPCIDLLCREYLSAPPVVLVAKFLCLRDRRRGAATLLQMEIDVDL